MRTMCSIKESLTAYAKKQFGGILKARPFHRTITALGQPTGTELFLQVDSLP